MSFIVKQTGHISCEVTGSKKYWADLEHVDLEIPPKMTFCKTNGRISKDMKSKLQLCFFKFFTQDASDQTNFTGHTKTFCS